MRCDLPSTPVDLMTMCVLLGVASGAEGIVRSRMTLQCPRAFPGPRAEQGALVNVKKTIHTIIVVFLVVFCLYYVFTDPAGTARVIRGFFSGLFGFIRALGGQS